MVIAKPKPYRAVDASRTDFRGLSHYECHDNNIAKLPWAEYVNNWSFEGFSVLRMPFKFLGGTSASAIEFGAPSTSVYLGFGTADPRVIFADPYPDLDKPVPVAGWVRVSRRVLRVLWVSTGLGRISLLPRARAPQRQLTCAPR